MLPEITSFNQIFAEAAALGFRLNNLSQTRDGQWRCNWRLDERPGTKLPWFGDMAEHERPFDAALAALTLAENEITKRNKEHFVAVVQTLNAAVDLFG